MSSLVAVMSTTPTQIISAAGWLALLQEPDVALQSHALTKLLECVEFSWHEVAESLPDLEAISENSKLPVTTRHTAAAVASHVFFHLGEPQQALRLALEAGDFDLSRNDTYSKRLLTAALDAYIAFRRGEDEEDHFHSNTEITTLPIGSLKALVHKLLISSCEKGHAADALGIALEAHEIDQVHFILKRYPHLCSMALESPMSSKAFRTKVFQSIAECIPMDQIVLRVLVHQRLNQPEPVAKVLLQLLSGTDDQALLGYQVCFDLIDSGDQAFIHAVASHIPSLSEPNLRWKQAERILLGGFESELALSFMHKNSNADRLIMEQLKKALEERGSGGRNSILHNAAVVTHSYLYAGTTNDSFLRDYLDWMKKASNWAKFSATASLGVIHAGHVTEAMNLLQPYLPEPITDDVSGNNNVSSTGGYAQGGSLYALGLIHGSHAGSSAEKRKEACDFIRKHLRASHANEVISHGAALGVGLTSLGSADFVIINELKELLYTDSAVAGEAAAIAIGMVLVGSGAGNLHSSLDSQNGDELMEFVSELKSYARETQHEKIIRGIAISLALINYGQEENADALIEDMRSDRDPILRYGAQYAIALAYIGTGSNKAIRILLHTAVSDVSDDVRMAAVLGLAFVLYKTPDRVPQLVKLLLESFNPHVRYASCMAVGISMAGSGDSESISLLEPMLDDMTDFVRQGALMGIAMIYMQQSDICNGKKIRSFRERLTNIVKDKHQSAMTKMGAVLAKGIIDAGGRNVSIILGSRNGFTKMTGAVGVTLWLQHWHWYPMLHMFSLAVAPTFMIGLNHELKYPRSFEIVCDSRPSLFMYPKQTEEKKEEKKKRVETVTLSTTAKSKARLARKRAKEGGDESLRMEIDETECKVDDQDEKKDMDVDEEEPKKKRRESEQTSYRLRNPTRITKAQAKVCEFIMDQRYRPIRTMEKPYGVVILTDSTPDMDDDDLAAVKAPSLEPEGECAPPEPFEWSPEELNVE